jgi:hypothetical protein
MFFWFLFLIPLMLEDVGPVPRSKAEYEIRVEQAVTETDVQSTNEATGEAPQKPMCCGPNPPPPPPPGRGG